MPLPATTPPALNDAVFEEYAKTIKRMRADLGLTDAELPDPSSSPEAEADGEGPLSNIQLRILTGSEGIAFPKPEEVVIEPTPAPEASAPIETPAPTPTPWQPPKKCPKSETIKNVILAETSDTEILNDRLFLPEDYIPIDEGEVYGPGVSFYPYGPNQGDGQLLSQEMFLVPCLPYRIRQTPWGQYEHRGDDALKRYGSSGMSSATFHPWVEQKLYGTARKSPRRGR